MLMKFLRLSILCLFFIVPVSAFAQVPTVSINDVTVIEGDPGILSEAIFTLTLSAKSQQTISVLASTQSGSADTAAPIPGIHQDHRRPCRAYPSTK